MQVTRLQDVGCRLRCPHSLLHARHGIPLLMSKELPGRRSHPCKAVFAPSPDLNTLWDNHVATEFSEKSADAAVATMVPNATVNHVPTMTGGVGTEALRTFYAENFIPKMPEDVKLTPIDRTIAKDTIVDEFVFEFTHNVVMDWMLPGIAPTGRKVKVPFVVVVKFEGDKVSWIFQFIWHHATHAAM